jgi:carboxymethylenebutenolidase
MTNLCRLVLGLAVLVGAPLPSQGQSLSEPETVVVESGGLKLRGLLWSPAGAGPFPAVLFNHGNGSPDPTKQPVVLGPVFARHGYTFLYLFRRGAGLSADQGPNSGALMRRALGEKGQEARNELQLQLQEVELGDVMAGLMFLRSRPKVDGRRVAIVGHSFGGQLTLLAAERDTGIRAAVTFAAGAVSWSGSPELRERMVVAVRNIQIPIFLTHAANDFSVLPGQVMAAELARLKRPHELKIYPAVGNTPQEGHQAVYLDVASWEADVFRFLDAHVLQSR